MSVIDFSFPAEAAHGATIPGSHAGRGRMLPALALAASDLLVLAASAGAAGIALAGTGTGVLLPGLFEIAALVQVGAIAASGGYPGYGFLPEAQLRRATLSWACAGGVATLAALALVPATVQEIAIFWAVFALAGVLQVAAAWVVRAVLASRGAWGEPVVLMGDPDKMAELARELLARRWLGYVPVSDILEARTVLWAGRDMPDPGTLQALSHSGRTVVLTADLPKLELTGLHPAQIGGAAGICLARPQAPTGHAALKRALDLFIAIPAMFVALPVVGLAAILIKCVDPGPAFYVQVREGLNGRRIGVLKLRTMYLDADRMLADLLARDPAARAEWETHFKLRRDPRILPMVGSFLRASSLDELPQLWNVLRGDMSLVGPRPFPEYHLAAMPAAFRARRASVVPGLTGLWQISERSSADLATQQALDDYYIAGRTLWGDLSILLRTFSAVLGRRGAY
ncbi:sugar transferase [Roseivivax isoporae]|uniref:Bacterial sugar transferase domain-containing protein n=1 Tax=Roseivivax isoporae LMG 25204 TaxID=1449351 RepID=X7F738_9RHOB|nr:sugar transferase [Roseivivax isoporae]ETX28742.1 hypothetical protein RISW2_05430 [Roseivivax isoporae LMG 25204]